MGRAWGKKILERFFAVIKFIKNCAKIIHFKHADAKSLHDTWKHFLLQLKWCPGHDIDELNQMQISTQRLRALIRMLLDASARYTVMTKSDPEVWDLEENKVQKKFYIAIDTGAKT